MFVGHFHCQGYMLANDIFVWQLWLNIRICVSGNVRSDISLGAWLNFMLRAVISYFFIQRHNVKVTHCMYLWIGLQWFNIKTTLCRDFTFLLHKSAIPWNTTIEILHLSINIYHMCIIDIHRTSFIICGNLNNWCITWSYLMTSYQQEKAANNIETKY